MSEPTWILSYNTPNGSILDLNGQMAWRKDKSFKNQREQQSSYTIIENPKEGELRGAIQAFKSIHCLLKSWSYLLRTRKTFKSTEISTSKSSDVLKLQRIRQLSLSFIVAYFCMFIIGLWDSEKPQGLLVSSCKTKVSLWDFKKPWGLLVGPCETKIG